MTPTETFVQEAVEGLEVIETLLLELESEAEPNRIDALFRTMHTIKGSGAMFGFDALARFTHRFETAFDLVRAGRLELDRGLIDLSLAACDHMGKLLHANDDPARIAALESDPAACRIAERLAALVGDAASPPPAGTAPAPRDGTPATMRTLAIRYMPAAEAFRNGTRPDLLLQELAGLGDMQVTIDPAGVPELEVLDPTSCHLAWQVDLRTDRAPSAIEDVFVFVEPEEYTIAPLPDQPAEAGAAPPPEANETTAPVPPANAPAMPHRSDTVKVPAERLDDLMDQLGELVIAQTRLAQLAKDGADPHMITVAEEIHRLVTGLRDSTLAMRMLPIEIVFGKFRRVVRSLADELGKDVALVTAGGDTELDKNVIDSLTEPLVHMIRNSMDHGIERAADRVAAGKPARATIGLVARQSGGEVLISVSDDGRGLDEDRIIAKARERGLIGPRAEDVPPRAQVHQMIFEPAFSTADAVSSVSGRGVGMDAVRRVVTDLRGSIDIATELGAGTAITLRLPVTLAIIDGLLVRVGEGVFVLPLSAVHECVEINETEYTRKSGRTMLRIRDELVPFIKFDSLLGLGDARGDGRRVVIVSAESRRVGIVVDDVLGQHQTVIKTFSQFHRDVAGFSGSTILGDGRVALIVDVAMLIRTAEEHGDPSRSAA